MSETCFAHCIDNFNSRTLDLNEEGCIEKCMNKYINVNHRVMGIYAGAQQKIMQKRIEEQTLANEQLPEVSNTNTTQEVVVDTKNETN